jgi:hypothetical protein
VIGSFFKQIGSFFKQIGSFFKQIGSFYKQISYFRNALRIYLFRFFLLIIDDTSCISESTDYIADTALYRVFRWVILVVCIKII